MVESSQAIYRSGTSQRIVQQNEFNGKGVIMRIRILFGAVVLTSLVGGVFAQTDHTRKEGSLKAVESKAAPDTKPQITAKDLKERLGKGEKVIILDARHDLAGQILKGALHVPIEKLEEWAKNADKDTLIVTYCTC